MTAELAEGCGGGGGGGVSQWKQKSIILDYFLVLWVSPVHTTMIFLNLLYWLSQVGKKANVVPFFAIGRQIVQCTSSFHSFFLYCYMEGGGHCEKVGDGRWREG